MGYVVAQGTKIHISKKGSPFLVPLIWIRYYRQDPSTDKTDLHTHRHYSVYETGKDENGSLAGLSEQANEEWGRLGLILIVTLICSEGSFNTKVFLSQTTQTLTLPFTLIMN